MESHYRRCEAFKIRFSNARLQVSYGKIYNEILSGALNNVSRRFKTIPKHMMTDQSMRPYYLAH